MGHSQRAIERAASVTHAVEDRNGAPLDLMIRGRDGLAPCCGLDGAQKGLSGAPKSRGGGSPRCNLVTIIAVAQCRA